MNQSVPKEPERWGPAEFELGRTAALKRRPAEKGALSEWVGRRRDLILAYRMGYGTEPKYIRYFELLKELAELEAERGDLTTDAMWELANAYRDGVGCVPSQDAYLDWLMRAAELGDRSAMADLAEEHRGKDDDEFFRWTTRLAELDKPVPGALIDLALAYRDGRGVKQDNNEYYRCSCAAVDRAKSAIQQPEREDYTSEDLPNAYALVANAYKFGMGVSRDEKRYFNCLNLAVAAADEAIQYAIDNNRVREDELRQKLAAPMREELALANVEGTGTAANLEMAFRLFRQAAREGLPSAKRRLACCYRDGRGVRKNAVKYFEWIDDAADCDDLEAIYQRACAYGMTTGPRHDPEKFLQGIRIALAKGHRTAFMALGVAKLQSGELIKPSDAKILLERFHELFNQTLNRREVHRVSKADAHVSDGIAHFTTLEALHMMLPKVGSGVRDRKNLLRLYNIEYVNDPEEGQLLLNTRIQESNLIRQFFPVLGRDGDYDNSVMYEPLPLRGLPFSVYVGCFTERKDDLDLWRAYGMNGDGFLHCHTLTCVP